MRLTASRLRRLSPVLLVLAALGWGRWRGVETKATDAEPGPSSSAVSGPTSAASSLRAASARSEPSLDLGAVEAAEHRAQIARVVEAMDRTGAPPDRVAQGGRRGGQKGVFQNAEGRLPRKTLGYWVESDVWPTNGRRDAERLIFGREREVYWTRDHYQSFLRLR